MSESTVEDAIQSLHTRIQDLTADLAALRRAAVRVTGCDVDADTSILLAALGMLPSFEERWGIVQVLRDAAGGALSPGDTAAVLAVLSRSVPAGEAPRPATPPLAQALDLLRRTRAVLHKLDPAHERLRGEISTILTSTPIEDLRDIAHPTVDREPIVELVTECPKCATPVKLATTPITQALGLLRRARPWVTADPFDRDSDPARMPSDQVKRLAAEIDALLAGAPVARAVDASLEARALAAFDAWGWGTRRIRPLTEPPIRVDRNAPDTKALWQTIVRAVDASRPEPPRAPLTEEEAAKQSAPDARPVSASSTAGEWQCVSCHAHETEMHRAWCEIEGAAGTVAIKSAPHTHPLTKADRAAGFSPAWTDDKPHTWVAPAELDEKKA